MTALEIVEARLRDNTGSTGRNGSWPCPAHDDRNPSLSVAPGNDGVVMHCHAGCRTEDVVAALGLTMADLFDTPKSNGSDITATYDYVDEAGTLLFQVVRKPGKQFLQRRPDGHGGWEWKLGDTRRVPYRLPEVLDAQTVFIVEGEKDADRLAADGHVATCNPHGAGKWRSSYNNAFKGADVIIVADKDEAGRDHARHIAHELVSIAASIRVVEAAVGKDISDHYAAGLPVDDLVLVDLDGDEITEAATPLDVTVVTLDKFGAVNEPGAEALLGDGGDAVIPAGGNVMVYGDGGAGKTTLTVDLACHLGAGDDWLGITVTRPLTVLLIENEGPRPLFRAKADRKVKAWTGSPLGGRVRVVESPWATLSFADETHRHALAKTIADHECDLVMVGPLACSGMTEAGTLAEVRAFLALVDDVRRRSGRTVTFLLVHHPNRAGTPSGAWEGAGDTLLHVTGMGHGRTRLHVQKARWSSTWHARTLELNWTDGESYEVDVKPEITDDNIADRIVAAVAENPGTGWTNVEKAVTGIQGTRRRNIRDRLLTDGKLVNIAKDNGKEVALNHCRKGNPARLYIASDPTVSHLRPDPDEGGTKPSSAPGAVVNPTFVPSSLQ